MSRILFDMRILFDIGEERLVVAAGVNKLVRRICQR